MGGDWHQFLQSIFLGLIFSYLLAKLISIVVSFKDDNLTISRGQTKSTADLASGNLSTIQETESVMAEHGSVRNESVAGSGTDNDDDDDDDWEGVESTELDEMFSAATAFVAAAAADRLSQKVSTDVQLQLYGLYKIATEGPCSAPPPSAIKMTARAKWQAWQKLGALPPEDAMQKYIDIVTELYPSWASGSTIKRKGGGGDSQSTDAKGPMGPVFSTYVYEEESGNELQMEAIHAFAREGDVKNLLKCIDTGVSVNLKDSEGRSPMHWAVDRGHLNVVEVLVGRNTDINAKDNEGQTPLHYAAVCERGAIAEFLVKQNADTNIKDNDGKSANDLCELDWPCLRHT
ncbi:acyl-CoA-binding domain-containing protein 1 [Ricinus communis]|uniref:Acyl-coenzyme A binding domain containing, putative n=1 Tax=Ricinus communis TaxID=3988 RepID=B9SJT4_RICCO|nr:acyl-CoA-binding domain-containing protein 1 [Ricinus communis]XP_048235302.1 acyl-CoA-binding domain-containing protein 1 [Ricinus communis]EEF36122.1 acyl-coenzyme A binding domain containing, putative [Ricinus communis]|eukprot:XP_015579102.1 acyl-CoA-binding domain-containing protein 1 [Ricinus communis]